ncbi:antimicrobial peptide 1-like [Papaver somniferum]|uniref:antimicrobial peptide 1-like n=1 Tax=Papaver somniferum TaxID=3469 RepID=UPI000E6FF5C1|nr:antimicrobial peptide 1-like [Papaver somniferum]
MASTTKKSLSMLFMAFFLMAAIVSELANATSFTVYRLGGCDGDSETYSKCGCSNLLYMGGFTWTFTSPGPSATMYNNGNCLGEGGTVFAGATEQMCNGFQFPWRSININC